MCTVAPTTPSCRGGNTTTTVSTSSMELYKRSRSNDCTTDEISKNLKRIREDQSSLSDPFRCPICLDTYGCTIVECSSCSNIFCNLCLEECLKRKDVCPLCRKKPTPLRRNKPIERLVAALPDSCPYNSNGCVEKVTRGSKNEHMERCDLAPIVCCHCEQSFLRKDHDLNECPKRQVKCPYEILGCHASVMLKDLQKHASDESHFELARSELRRIAKETTFPREILSALQDLIKVSRRVPETETLGRFKKCLREANHRDLEELQSINNLNGFELGYPVDNRVERFERLTEHQQ